MSQTSTETTIVETFSGSFSQSPPSFGFSLDPPASRRRENAQISKIYKHASSLFLTRRLAEALSAIEPLITITSTDGSSAEDEDSVAPIVNASRNLRVKVWSLYLTLLNSIIDIGPEDGKIAIGGQLWRSIRDKARDGSIWDEVVQVGYGGVEEKVDTDVVINLVTLLLSHSPSQTANQQRLETYLAAPTESTPGQNDHFEQNSPGSYTTGGSHYEASTNTPRDLTSRIRILELYTLHILPHNEEWEYAREFINMSNILDQETQEAFLQTLQNLQDEITKGHNSGPSPLQAQPPIPEPEPESEPKPESEQPATQKESFSDHSPQNSQPQAPPTNLPNEKPHTINRPKPVQAPPPKSLPKPTLYYRSLNLLSTLNRLLATALSLSRNPLAVLRLVLFVAALVVALSRRGVRERVGRAWDKVRETVGMGVRVGYI